MVQNSQIVRLAIAISAMSCAAPLSASSGGGESKSANSAWHNVRYVDGRYYYDDVAWVEAGAEGSAFLAVHFKNRPGEAWFVFLHGKSMYVRVTGDKTVRLETTQPGGLIIARDQAPVRPTPEEQRECYASLPLWLMELHSADVTDRYPFLAGDSDAKALRAGVTVDAADAICKKMNLKPVYKGVRRGRIIAQSQPAGTRVSWLCRNITLTCAPDATDDRQDGIRFGTAYELVDSDGDHNVNDTQLLTSAHVKERQAPCKPDAGFEMVWKLPSIPAGSTVTVGRTDAGADMTLSVWTNPDNPAPLAGACKSGSSPKFNFRMPAESAFLVAELASNDAQSVSVYATWTEPGR